MGAASVLMWHVCAVLLGVCRGSSAAVENKSSGSLLGLLSASTNKRPELHDLRTTKQTNCSSFETELES